jgi:hypothetical protein
MLVLAACTRLACFDNPVPWIAIIRLACRTPGEFIEKPASRGGIKTRELAVSALEAKTSEL